MKVVLVVVTLATTAAAEPAPVEPPPAVSTSQLYTSLGLGIGAMAETGENGNAIVLVHGSLGIELGAPGTTNIRLGAGVDVLDAYDQSIALGVEAQLDTPVGGGWHVGGRGAFGFSFNQQRLMGAFGVRARTRWIGFGLDAVVFGSSRSGRDVMPGVMGSIGLEGTPARYGLAIGGSAGLLLFGLALAALRNTH